MCVCACGQGRSPVALETEADRQAEANTVLGDGDKPTGNGIAANPQLEDKYCEVFSDPAECEQQRVEGVQKFWTAAELRHELWKTMSALAELEIRENAQHKQAKKKAQDQAKLFNLFRKTMSKEVEDIHRVQDEMHQRHTAAFQQLVNQLANVTVFLRQVCHGIQHVAWVAVCRGDCPFANVSVMAAHHRWPERHGRADSWRQLDGKEGSRSRPEDAVGQDCAYQQEN